MTIRTRLVFGISAAALSLGVAYAPVAFAMDKKDDGMKKDTMSKSTMSKSNMKKHSSKGTMSKGSMSKDSMKKDDNMMKKN